MKKIYLHSFAVFIALFFYSVIAGSQPVVEKKLNNFSSVVTDEESIVNLTEYFSAPEDSGLSFKILVNSIPEVASTRIEGNKLHIKFLSAGQTNISVEAESASGKVAQHFVAGVQPILEGDFIVSDFNNLDLGEALYWNGNDLSGGFSNGLSFFPNQYHAWGGWDGWSYTLMSDTITPDFTNQYSAITGRGATIPHIENDIYVMGYQPESIKFTGTSAHQVAGMFVTNSTYAALSMRSGDAFAKKFGGVDGTEPDWFKLVIKGMRMGESTGEVDFFLADFRHEDNSHDYIVETWQWVDLSPLGKVDSLVFKLSSTDMGAWGMNTPAYFAIDNMMVIPDKAPLAMRELPDMVVRMNAEPIEINISGLFSDPDDDDEAIEIAVFSNSNSSLVTPGIIHSTLVLTLSENSHGDSNIELQAISNGKTALVGFNLKVEDTSSIPYFSNRLATVYPNPSDGLFLMKNVPINTIYMIEVYNFSGQLVHKGLIHDISNQIDLRHLPAGIYITRLSATEHMLQSTMIIK
jgi:hypothetical protein